MSDSATPSTAAPGTALSIWRETDWVPNRSIADKDSDEYEQNFQLAKRKKILVIVTAALVVVGTAIAVILATSTSSEGATTSSGIAETTPAPQSNVGEVLAGSNGSGETSDSSLNVVETPIENVTNSSNIESITFETTTVEPTPEPTPQPTPAPTPEPTPEPTPAPTPPPTTTTPAPTPKPTAPVLKGSMRHVNKCGRQIELMYTTDHKDRYITLQPDETFDMPGTYSIATIRVGRSPEATLFETCRDGGKFWYDISVIPPDCGNGMSWEACSKGGKVKGFNVPVKVELYGLANNRGYNCVPLTCQWEKCADAYLFPFDDIHTKNCHLDEAFIVSWCGK